MKKIDQLEGRGRRVRELRFAAAAALGKKKLTQGEAAELVGSRARNWYDWEVSTKKMSPAAVELFCYKTGLRYTPDILETDMPIEVASGVESSPDSLFTASDNRGGDRLFLTLTSSETLLPITVNASVIKKYTMNKKTRGTCVELVDGDIFEVEQSPLEIDRALGTSRIIV